MTFQELCKTLETKIQQSYEQGTSLEDAERLAGEFLNAMIKVSEELKTEDLSSRMRKSGLKAIRASAYLQICKNAERKPTESAIDAEITADKIVQQEQQSLDEAEVNRDNLERYYNIFQNAHIFYRAVSKGRFE
jgi:hypothetical protein